MKTGLNRNFIGVRLNDRLLEKVDRHATKSKRNRSDFIRFVVETAIENEEAKELKTEVRK